MYLIELVPEMLWLICPGRTQSPGEANTGNLLLDVLGNSTAPMIRFTIRFIQKRCSISSDCMSLCRLQLRSPSFQVLRISQPIGAVLHVACFTTRWQKMRRVPKCSVLASNPNRLFLQVDIYTNINSCILNKW